MAIMNINGRQHSRFALAEVDAELSEGTTMLLPPGAIVMSAGYNITEAATGTTPTISLADDQDTPLDYMAAVAFAVADAAITAADRQFYPAGATLTFSIGGTTPAGGKAYVWVEYISITAQDELYGRSA